MDITHEDYSYSIDSHPYLPLYMTGNSRGLLCLWQFNQPDDRALDCWVTSSGNDGGDLLSKGFNAKKSTIKKI